MIFSKFISITISSNTERTSLAMVMNFFVIFLIFWSLLVDKVNDLFCLSQTFLKILFLFYNGQYNDFYENFNQN